MSKLSLELRIRQWLKDFADPARAADEVLKLWDQGALSWQDQEIAGRFLLNAGFAPSLLNRFARQLKKKQLLQWANFLDALASSSLRLSSEDFDALFLGAGEENQIENLVRTQSMDSREPRFQKIRARLKVQHLAETSPTPLKSDFFRVLLAKEQKAAPEIQIAEARIGAELVRRGQENPNVAHDTAVSLMLMGLSEHGLQLLDSISDQDARKDWLQLELLLSASRGLDALQWSEHLAQKYFDNAEYSLSALYGQSLALAELGRTSEAKALLEKILSISPQYRSAHSLLLQWSQEDA